MSIIFGVSFMKLTAILALIMLAALLLPVVLINLLQLDDMPRHEPNVGDE